MTPLPHACPAGGRTRVRRRRKEDNPQMCSGWRRPLGTSRLRGLQNLYVSGSIFRPFDQPRSDVSLSFHPRVEPVPEGKHPLIIVLARATVPGVPGLYEIMRAQRGLEISAYEM